MEAGSGSHRTRSKYSSTNQRRRGSWSTWTAGTSCSIGPSRYRPRPLAPSQPTRGRGAPRGLRVDHDMTLGSQAVDPHLHHVARLEIARRLGAMADSGRSAGGDEIADPERHEAADIGDELADREDHVLGVTALTVLAVDRGPEREPLRVGDLVGGHEPGTDGSEGVRALALGGAAAVLHLEGALGDVVHEAIRRDVTEGVGLVDPARFPAHHRHELHL